MIALILSILGYWYLAAALACTGLVVARRQMSAVMIGADIIGGTAGIGVLFLLLARIVG